MSDHTKTMSSSSDTDKQTSRPNILVARAVEPGEIMGQSLPFSRPNILVARVVEPGEKMGEILVNGHDATHLIRDLLKLPLDEDHPDVKAYRACLGRYMPR